MVLFDDNEPPIILPIGSTGIGGLILMITEAEGQGSIFLKQPFGDFYYLTETLEEFFGLLHEPAWG